MDPQFGTPSFLRFSHKALACADVDAVRHTYPGIDLDYSINFIVEVAHTAGFSTPGYTLDGEVAWAASTTQLPLEWRGCHPDFTVLYRVVEKPTRFAILRVFFRDAGAVFAAFNVISEYSLHGVHHTKTTQ